MAGKGSKPRPTDLRRFGKNYDEINWHRPLPKFKEEPEGVIFYPDGWFDKLIDKKRNRG